MTGRAPRRYQPPRNLPALRKPARQPRRKAKGLLSDLAGFMIAAVVLGGLSFGAVIFDLPALLNSSGSGESAGVSTTGSLGTIFSGGDEAASSPLTEANVRQIALQLMGKTPPSVVQLRLRGRRMQVTLGSTRFWLEPPSGHCFLDAQHPADARLHNVLQRIFSTDIRLIGGFADCAQLEAWRSGKRKTLRDYGKFLTPLAVLDKRATGSPRKLVATMCRTMRSEGGEFSLRGRRSLKAQFERALASAKMNESRSLGVIDEDSHACYFGMLQKLQTETGEVKTQIDVSVAAIISGKMIYSNLYAALENDGTLRELLDRQKANVARNVAANR